MAPTNDLRSKGVRYARHINGPAYIIQIKLISIYCVYLYSLIHLFSWSGLIDANILLSDLFKVPNLQTGRMEPLITALSPEEEEMACNMLRRLNTIFSVE